MIDKAIRATAIGASDIACILGMNPFRDAFSVWAEKTGQIDSPEPNKRMRKGKYMEEAVAHWFSDVHGVPVVWFDSTVRHASRTFQCASPDAFELDGDGARSGVVEVKIVGWDQRWGWGEPGGSKIPDHYALQCQWLCSTTDLPYASVAAQIGDDLSVYRVDRDPDIEATLLDVGRRWWHEHIELGKAPEIGDTAAAAAYLKKRFPKNTDVVRCATEEETALILRYRSLCEAWDAVNHDCQVAENRLKEIIGEDAGLISGDLRVTYKKCKDSEGVDFAKLGVEVLSGPDYQWLAEQLLSRLPKADRELLLKDCAKRSPVWRDEMKARFYGILKAGSRRINRSWDRTHKT